MSLGDAFRYMGIAAVVLVAALAIWLGFRGQARLARVRRAMLTADRDADRSD